MPVNYFDADCYAFHERDDAERCFLCAGRPPKLIVVRHVASMKMAHLCERCFLGHLSDFLLDNTRPWFGPSR
jgi:hypothetical protein